MYLMPLHCQLALKHPSHFQFLEFLISTATLAANLGQHKIQQKKKKRESESQKNVLTEKRTEICGPMVDYKLKLSPECPEPP